MPEGASEGVKKSGRYKADIESLLKRGELLSLALQFTCYPDEPKRYKAEVLAKLPSFSSDYQEWYSECVSCLSQLLPHRLEDFRGYYDLGKPRKEITAANYCIRDALLGLQVTSGQEPWKQVVVDAERFEVNSQHGFYQTAARWSPKGRDHQLRPHLDESPRRGGTTISHGRGRDRGGFD